MTPSSIFRFLYPETSAWMRTGLMDVIARDRIIEPFMKFGHMTHQEALDALAYGSEPEVRPYEIGGPSDPGGNEKGYTPINQTKVIYLRSDLCDKSEEKLKGGGGRATRQFEITLLHEMVHWGNNKHQLPTRPNGHELRGEMGTRFERHAYRLPYIPG